MGSVPAGFNGAISPKLQACVSQDCNKITFSDVTLLAGTINPYGWDIAFEEPLRQRSLAAFKEIRIIATNSSGEEVLNLLTYSAVGADIFSLYPEVNALTDNMPLSTAVWGLSDGVYSFNYKFTYHDESVLYGDVNNVLALAGKTVEAKFNQVITCNAQNKVKDLWLKYLNDCCSANKDKALEAEALLYSVEAAAACADEYNASRIKDALDKILDLDSGKCNSCKHSKCKC